MNKITGGQGVVECAGLKYNVECTIVDGNGITRRVYGCATDDELAHQNAKYEASKLDGTIVECINF